MGRVRAHQIVDTATAIGLAVDPTKARHILKRVGMTDAQLDRMKVNAEFEKWRSDGREGITSRFL